MVKRNKGWRHRQMMLYWKRRLNVYTAYADFSICNDEGELMLHPSWRQLAASKWGKVYKTTGTPCSCWLCQGARYERNESNKDTLRIIRESEE